MEGEDLQTFGKRIIEALEALPDDALEFRLQMLETLASAKKVVMIAVMDEKTTKSDTHGCESWEDVFGMMKTANLRFGEQYLKSVKRPIDVTAPQ